MARNPARTKAPSAGDATPKSADKGAGRTTRARSAAPDARLRSPASRLDTPTDLKPEAVQAISQGLTQLLADFFALYLKTKNFHWHVSGPHFYSYHLLLDAQAAEIFAATDDVAERARRIGGTTLRSIGQISQLQRLRDNDATYVDPLEMLRELREDNKACVANMRKLHDVCDENEDVATASLIENWIDQAENRTWFLYEASRQADQTGH